VVVSGVAAVGSGVPMRIVCPKASIWPIANRYASSDSVRAIRLGSVIRRMQYNGRSIPPGRVVFAQTVEQGNTNPLRSRQVRMPNFRKITENSFVVAVEHYASISSTNDRALAAAHDPSVQLPLLVLADEQTAGRGRGANRWWTGPGSLAFSLLMPPGAGSTGFSRQDRWSPGFSRSPDEQPPKGGTPTQQPLARGTPARHPATLVALAVGVAVVDALTPLVTGHELGIHWPNDVMLDGRKLAGILIETLPDGKQVIGAGINTNNTAADAPAEVRPRVATLLDTTGQAHDSVELLISILNYLEERLIELARSPQRIAARTNELCLQRGTMVQVRQGDSRIVGTCLGIAADGALVLQCADRQQAVYSGSVVPASGKL
jgi:BirA family transcriptional regulator, biotin operon repressor / biotin---[acetyl-CoA-carboxylase] ligase